MSFLSGDKGWKRLFLDGDSGFHIRIGELILQTGQVPTTDPFSFSLPGKDWFAFEWGAEVLQASLNQAWGLKGVAIMTGLILAFTFVLVFLFCLWRGANGGISLLLTFLTVNAASIHFHARPHIFTLLLLVIAAWLLEQDRRKPSRYVWLLIPITVLWANLHGAFPILFVFIGLLVVGLLAEGWLDPKLRPEKYRHAFRFGLLGFACLAASLINPYGYHVHQHILETMRAKWLIAIVDEFKSPSFRSEQLMVFMILLFLGLASLGRLVARRKLCEAAIILFFAWASLTSVRHVPLFVLMASPIMAVELTALWASFAATRPHTSVFRILDDLSNKLSAGNRHPSLWALVFVFYLCIASAMVWPKDLSDETFPTALVTRHQSPLASARVFTTDQWGGYLIYRNFPTQKVFIDGRHNYYGEKIVTEMVQLLGGAVETQKLLDKYQFEFVMVPPEAALATILRMLPAWTLIDQDKQALLFQRARS